MTEGEGGKVLEFPTKVKPKKNKKDDGDVNIGCYGCGSGCLSWPVVLIILAVLIFRGVTFYGHHYFFSITHDHGLELHDDEVGPEDEAP